MWRFEKMLLALAENGIQFPASERGSSPSAVTPSPGDQRPSSGLHGVLAYTHNRHTLIYKDKFLRINICMRL